VALLVGDAAGSKHDTIHVREDNPALGVEGPDRGARKAKQFLYPSEFLKLMNAPSEVVPLAFRRAVAIAVYTYTRDGELRALRWDGGDLDLDHGVLSITRALRQGEAKATKSGETRRFALEPNLLPLLRAMHDQRGGKGPVVHLRGDHMARLLREWLEAAGVDRPELHKGTPTRKPLTWHDLRATGATWMAVRGDDPLKIKQRCGHASFSTTELYIREAEAVRDGFGEVFPALPDDLLGGEESSGESFRGATTPPKLRLRGQDLNLRPSGYEKAERSLRGLVSL
jgi:integrase